MIGTEANLIGKFIPSGIQYQGIGRNLSTYAGQKAAKSKQAQAVVCLDFFHVFIGWVDWVDIGVDRVDGV